jgi:hypothetical protein
MFFISWRILTFGALLASISSSIYLRDESIRFRQDGNVDGRKRLMIHAPSVGADAVHRTMKDGLVHGLLSLRCAEAQAKNAGQVEPIHA